jgi:hypothetical protein
MYADLVCLLAMFSKKTLTETQYKGITRPAVNSRTAGHVTGEARVKVSSAKTRLKKKQTS